MVDRRESQPSGGSSEGRPSSEARAQGRLPPSREIPVGVASLARSAAAARLELGRMRRLARADWSMR